MANKSNATIDAINDLVKALEGYGFAGYGAIDVPLLPVEPKDRDYPHVCPKCKGPAYIGFSNITCKANC